MLYKKIQDANFKTTKALYCYIDFMHKLAYMHKLGNESAVCAGGCQSQCRSSCVS